MSLVQKIMLTIVLGSFCSSESFITIKSPDGDHIDCNPIMDQLAFTNPLLKNHQIQEYPSGMPKPKGETNAVQQIWHRSMLKCPTGTIPVRRETASMDTSDGQVHPKFYEIPANATRDHKYAVAFQESQDRVYGTQATLNVWDPKVEASDDFSLAQIWLATGSYDRGNLNTIEAGWVVFREKFHDNQPKLFTFWTRDAYRTRCNPSPCPGFIHTNSRIAENAAIETTSTYGGSQRDITLHVWKDSVTGNWWLGMGLNTTEPIGYWPHAIFTDLADHATMVHWGGEVLYRNTSGMSKTVPMGSGQFADQGFRKSAYFCNLKVAKGNYTLLPVQDIDVFADYPQYYTVKKKYNKDCGVHFFYGGPGPRPISSTAARGSLEFYLVFLYYVVVAFV